MVSALVLMDVIYEVQQMSFPALLQACLDEHSATIADLHDYLLEQDYNIEKTSLYRYFNPNPKVCRKPDDSFLALFADFLCLSPKQEAALYFLWKMKRIRRLAA